MAQIQEGSASAAKRLNQLMRQRPLIGICVALACGLLVGAVGLGVAQAGGLGQGRGFQIERSDNGREGGTDDGAALDEDGGGAAQAQKDADQSGEETIVVDVAGAVRKPMVVELEQGSRVRDAVEAAGGLAEDADEASVNQAAKLVDGQQVRIPHVGEAVTQGASTGSDAGSTSGVASHAGGAVNINTAGIEELDELPGVGPATAQAIVEDREANGPFSSIEDLMRVSGIGEKKFENLKADICV